MNPPNHRVLYGSRCRRRIRKMGALCTSASAVVLLVLVGVAQGRGTPTPPTVAAPSSSAEDSRQAELVRATERARLHALVEADVTVARRLSSDDLQVINPAGGVLGLEEYLAAVASGDIDYLAFEPASPIVVRLYGPTAVIRFQANFDLVVFGLRFTHQAWITELYERQRGDWQIVWEHATAIPNDLDLFLESIKPPR
jgi:Domain of unknown function (DUF4440)